MFGVGCEWFKKPFGFDSHWFHICFYTSSGVRLKQNYLHCIIDCFIRLEFHQFWFVWFRSSKRGEKAQGSIKLILESILSGVRFQKFVAEAWLKVTYMWSLEISSIWIVKVIISHYFRVMSTKWIFAARFP